LIAFYLPQFHPIPENDLWWGKGFTEWTNVAKARPLFRGHYQPHIPGDLGFYDLRLPEARAAQAALARVSGIEGFCYWHYWFAGKRMLERPFAEVLRTGEPDFPFCLGWANQTWSGIWHGAPGRILIEQTYPGPSDHEEHFHAILPAFHDPRYLRLREKPIFVIYRPSRLPRAAEFIDLWQNLAAKNGLTGIHFIAHEWFNEPHDYLSKGFGGAVFPDAFVASRMNAWQRAVRLHDSYRKYRSEGSDPLRYLRILVNAIGFKARKHLSPIFAKPNVINYREAMLYFLDQAASEPSSYPCIVPNWDNSPRSGPRSVVLHDSTPELFRQHVRQALDLVIRKPFEDRIVFVKSWNEWAEGNYLEPDLRFGCAYLDVLREEVLGANSNPGRGNPHEPLPNPIA